MQSAIHFPTTLISLRQDLCVSAALDAVKEHVDVPWRPAKQVPEDITTSTDAKSADTTGASTTNATGVLQPATPSTEPVEASSSEPIEASSSELSPSEPSSVLDSDVSPTPETSSDPASADTHPLRVLHWRHFTAALKEITPSSSETLGSLADLRKWNQEFGEGRTERKKQVWGKGRFGFTTQTLDGTGADGKVQPSTSTSSGSSPSGVSGGSA